MKAIRKTGVSGLSSKLLTALLCVIATSFVNANEIYVEQSGDGATIGISQDGNNNKVGDSSTPVYIGGNANNVSISQTGNTNELQMVVNGAAATVNVTTVGSGNTQTINCGTILSASCGSSTITQTVTGDNNVITQALGASATQTSIISVTGDANTITHTTTGSGAHSANITVNGGVALSGNTISVTQGGLNAQSVTVNSTGNSNAITINQQ